MKLDKRFILAASLVMGIGLGVSACGGDDGDDDELKANGEVCSAASECKSGNCAEGKCAEKTTEPTCNKTCGENAHVTTACECECNVGFKLDGEACVVDEENKCEKTEADCNADTETWNKAECKCDPKQADGCTKSADDCNEDQVWNEDECKCDPKNVCNLACAGENQEADTEACKCKCKSGFYDENKGEDGKEVSCKPVQEKPETCGNKAWDEGEVCDIDENGTAVFKAGEEKSCDDWAAENNLTSKYEGAPGCNVTCQALAQGSCKSDSCGNGSVDGDEKCETIDGKAYVSDGKGGKREATCADWEGGNENMTGAPTCNNKCSGIGKGSCSGVDTCKAEVAYDEASHKATATVTASNSDAKTAIVCASKTAGLEALVNNKDLAEGKEFDTSKLTDAGDYVCYVIYMGDTRSLCSKDGTIIKLSDATVDNAGLASFTVASEVTADTIAKWTFASATKATIAEQVKAGVAADEGDKEKVKLSYVDNGKEGITVTLTADNGGNNALTALQIKVAAAGKLGDTQKEDESAHISIGNLDTYTVTGLKMTARYEGGKIYVTAVDGTSEVIVKTIDDMTKDYAEKTVNGFAAGVSKINIYGDNSVAKAMSIDDVTIEGAAK